MIFSRWSCVDKYPTININSLLSFVCFRKLPRYFALVRIYTLSNYVKLLANDSDNVKT